MKQMILRIVTAILVTTTPVLASSGEEATGTSILVLLFLGFGALIIVCQLIPSILLFCSMMKGLFDTAVNKSIPKTGAKPL